MKRWALAVAGGALMGLLCSQGVALAGEAPKADLDAVMKQVAAYKYGESRKPLIEAEDLVKTSYSDAEQRKAIIAKLTALLGADATPDAKRFACRQLSIIGGPEVVPAAAKLLPDPDLSHMGRMVLERVPGPEATAALQAALGTLKGKLLIGVINSLGQRRDRPAAPAVAKFLGDADTGVAAAAATALGKMAGPEATAALAEIRAKAAPEVKPSVDNAYLRCADQLVADGKKAEAEAIYTQMTDAKETKVVRIAALRGLVAAGSDKAISLITAALMGDDAEMQAVATSFIREVKGADAVKTFAGLLPKLAPAVQVLVIGALAESGDAAARPAILEAAKSQEEPVRLAAWRAMASVGTVDDVALLAKTAAAGPNPERGPAADSLSRLGAKGVDEAILKLIDGADAALKGTLLRGLAARRCAAAVPTVLKTAEDADESVRVESLKALEVLADEKCVPALVKLLVGAKTDGERATAERTVYTVAAKGKDANQRVEPILAALSGAAVPARCSLLKVLGRLGGDKGLAAIRAALKEDNAQVKDAAIRALASWPDAAVADDLLALAKDAPQPTHKIIALRDYIRVVGLPSNRPAEATLKMYQEAMALAARPDEKKLVLGGIGQVNHVEALKMAEGCLADQALVNEAAAAVLSIAKAIGNAHKAEAIAALTKVTQESKDKRVAGEAAKLIKQFGG